MTTVTINVDGRYIELDGIRLIVEDGKIVGWYNPNKNNAD